MTTFLKVKDNAISTLSGAINASVTSLVVAAGDGTKFPSTYPFHITIESEILSCTLRAVDTLTVARAQQGTAAASHADGKMVQLKIMAKHLDDITEMFTSGKIVTYESEVVVHDGDVVYT